MPSTRDIRRRIKSVKNTAQITKAMQMVASTKMRRAQLAAIALRPYASRLDDMAAQLYASVGRKGRQTLVRLKKNLLADFELKDSPTFSESKTISRFLLAKFEEGE